MRFEDKPITFGPKPLIKDPYTMEKLIFKRENYFLRHKRPEIDEFVEYPKEKRESDKHQLEFLKKKFNQKIIDEEDSFIKNLSSIYEGAIFDLIEVNNFLGKDCHIEPTSEWDDIKNGIDGVMIFQSENKKDYFGGLEVDVTFSSRESNLEKKIESIKQCIRSGVLPKLEYFKNPKNGKHEIINLPKVIVGTEQTSAEGLVRLWGSSDVDKLKNHPVQSKIILEMLVQLRYFYDFAMSQFENTKELDKKEKYREIAIKYGEMNNYIYNIYLEKKDLIESHANEIASDNVYKNIVKILG
jgi:hypothetical protein